MADKRCIEDDKLKDDIISRMTQGELITKICKALNIDVVTLWRWREKDPIFDAKCIRALEAGHEVQADSILTAHDDIADFQKARLYSENAKWVLARRARSRYGDRVELDINNTVDIKGALTDARARIEKLAKPIIPELTQVIETTAQKQSTSTDSKSVEENEVEIFDPNDLLK